jgi:integrase
VKRIRHQNGGVYLDKRVATWYYRKTVDGKRELTRIGTTAEYPNKSAAVRASLTLMVNASEKKQPSITFETAARRYMAEKMPTRFTTSGGYRNYLQYCIRQWGDSELVAIEPMEVWQWVNNLVHPQTGKPLAGKTKAHVRAAMRMVYEFAMLARLYPITRNPIDLVKVTGATKRTRQRKVLTYEQWGRFIANVVAEPQRTAIITAMCLGIRREEVWALKWSDFDFVTNTVMIQRAIVGGKVLTVKTEASEAPLPLDEELVALLLDWRSKSKFNADTDWVWASPYSGGEMPLYFNAIQRDYIITASMNAGLGKIGWHCFRHTYRSWMNAQGTPLGIQKDLMRHSSIAMTTQYGAGVVSAMREANSAVVRMVIQ